MGAVLITVHYLEDNNQNCYCLMNQNKIKYIISMHNLITFRKCTIITSSA